MKRDSFRVLFFLKKNRLLKNGEASVCMRITVNGTRRDETEGCAISFRHSTPITIYNRTKEADGETLQIGLTQAEDGNWYRTLNAEPLTDTGGVADGNSSVGTVTVCHWGSNSGNGIGENQAGTGETTKAADTDVTGQRAVEQMNTALQNTGSEWRYELTEALSSLTKN